MDKYKIDSHKLIYHVLRVNKWLDGENIYPIYVEIGLHGECNHNCFFCAFDYLDKKPDVLDENIAKDLLLELSKKGIKSILYSGEGEPLLHKKAKEIIAFTKENKIDAALSTNGVLFDEVVANEILPHLTWIRVSLNAGSKESYSDIHGTDPEDFERVIKNLRSAVKLKRDNKYACTIGVQFLLLPKNVKELVPLASVLKSIGVDYLVVKPYSQHPSS
ncbi:MAG: radical SAM protein, partial [Candidatus Omnitrophica bacterium]|nr:radical SAM protein [Candidatus Omnitrophota bacterium]